MAGAAAGGTMRSTSITVPITISRRTITIVLKNTRTKARIGSITRNTGGMHSTGTRQPPRSTGSSVRAPGPGRLHPTPGVTAKVEVTEAVEELRRATSAVVVTARVQVTEAVEELKRVMSVVVAAARMRWMVLEEEEASALQVIGARRAEALPRAAPAVRGVRGAAAAVQEEPPEVEVAVVVAEAEAVAAN